MEPGERIKKLRKSKGLKQGELAETLGYSQAFLSEIERGVKKPSLHFLEQLMQEFEVSSDYILFGEKEKSHGIYPHFTERKEKKEVIVKVKYCPGLKSLDKNWPKISTESPSMAIPVSFKALKPRPEASYVMVLVEEDVGMSPLISKGDVIVADLNSKEPLEKNVYIVQYKGHTLLRYVTKYEDSKVKGYFLNAIDPGFGTAFVRITNKKEDFIMGRVLWVLKSLMGSSRGINGPGPGHEIER